MFYSTVLQLIIILLCIIITKQEEQLTRLITFQNCRDDLDCRENSFCYGNDLVNRGKCRCKENYILMDRNRTFYECLPVAEGYNSPCLRDIQCQISLGTLAICKEQENMCGCIATAHLSKDNRCYQTMGLGDYCKIDYNCRLDDGMYGFCVDGKCSCNIKHHPSPDNRRCIPSVDLGKSCSTSDSCIHTFANCYGGVCRCVAGYIESDDNKVCLKAASTFGENCTETIQCSAYLKDAFCNNNTCVCKSAHHGYGNECVLDAKLGDRCVHDKECILYPALEDSVRCTGGVCQCLIGVSDENNYGCVLKNNTVSTYQFIHLHLMFIIVFAFLFVYIN